MTKAVPEVNKNKRRAGIDDVRDGIIEALLPSIAFDGWIWEAVEAAAEKAGHDRAMASAVFPSGLPDVLRHFSGWADRGMLSLLSGIDADGLRVRDRVHTACMKRYEWLNPHKEAVRLAARYWGVPHRAGQATRLIWRTADVIWDWAGDTATDYNRYTKRGLLSGVLGSTTLVWLADQGRDLKETDAFLARRIENVMQLGRFIGKMKKPGGSRRGASA